MTRQLIQFAICVFASVASVQSFAAEPASTVKETVVTGPNDVALRIRMEGPYTADVPLQVVCYFRYSDALAQRMTGAPVELDKHLGGAIASLRERGEFRGDALETILIRTPEGSIQAKALLLVGLGPEESLSLETMERVGRVALREASRLGAAKVAFAPLLRDQGNSQLATGEVETAVVRGMLLAYDTEQRLQKQGLAQAYTLKEWWVEAGPTYFDETVVGVTKAVSQAAELAKARSTAPYANTSK